MPIPLPTIRRASRHPSADIARRVARPLAGALLIVSSIAGLAMSAAAASPGALRSRALPASDSAAAASLPGPTSVGQTASLSAAISVATSGGFGGPGGVDGSVGLMLTTSIAVTAVNPDGSYTRQTTIQSLNVVDAPAGADAKLGYDTLVGTTFEQQISANGTPIDSSLGDGLTGEQRVLGQGIVDAMDAMVIGFPSTPVSVGSSWTAPGRVGLATIVVPVTYQCRLTSISGDSYTVEVSYAQDVDANASAGTMSGTLSGSGTLNGSVSNPLVVAGTMYQSVDGVLAHNDGAATPVSGDMSITLTSADG